MLCLAALLGTVLGWVAFFQIQSLQREVRELRSGLVDLHRRARQDATPTPSKKQSEPLVPIAKPEPVPTQRPSAPVINPAPAIPLRVAVPSKAAPLPALEPAAPLPNPAELAPPKRSLEDRIGAQWSVWVGGLALLVGAVFLLRYSIESGFFGPGARVLMAGVFGAGLLAAGEWLLRADERDDDRAERLRALTSQIGDHLPIPALLSAVGIFTWLGAIYAAQALYGFITPVTAFVGLGLVSLGAMGLSLRQGPLLAGLGLLASLATPLLIQTETPSLTGLYAYLAIVGGAAVVLSRRTQWNWLALGAVIGWLGWSWFSLEGGAGQTGYLWGLFMLAAFGVTAWLASRTSKVRTAWAGLDDVRITPGVALVWGGVAAVLCLVLLDLVWDRAQFHEIKAYSARDVRKGEVSQAWVFGYLLPALAALGLAGRLFRRQSLHLLTALILLAGAAFVLRINGVDSATLPSHQTLYLILLAAASLGFLLSVFEAGRVENAPFGLKWVWPVAGTLAVLFLPLMVIGVWTDQVVAGWFFATVAALALVVASNMRRGHATHAGAYTAGAVTAYVIATTVLFSNLTLTVYWIAGLAVLAALCWFLRPPWGRICTAAMGVLIAARVLIFVSEPGWLGPTPIFNGLWLYLALPGAVLGALSYGLQRQKRAGRRTDIITLLALAFGALFVVFQIRHLFNAGEVYADTFGFDELGSQVSTGLCFTFAGLWSRRDQRADNLLVQVAELVSWISLAVFGAGSLLLASPLVVGSVLSDGRALAQLVLGFGLPTLLLGLCAVRASGRRSVNYVRALGVLCLAGTLSFVTALIRVLYSGTEIAVGIKGFGNAELYTISAAWLVLGIGLLAAGMRLGRRDLRLASAVVILLTVLKTFLVDMAGLEGVLRALSFVGLGLVLIVIGRAYQRMLSKAPERSTSPDR